MKKLLFVVAHAGDESLFAGGTIAKYSKAGWDIHLICASRGKSGECEFSDPTPGKTAEILNIGTYTVLDYDAGALALLSPGELEGTLFPIVKDYGPDVVITLEPGGITRHPDHKKASLAATFVFQKYAKSISTVQVPGQRGKRFWERQTLAESRKETTQDVKLYYACLPASVIAYLKKQKVIRVDPSGRFWAEIPDKSVTTVINIHKVVKKKAQAIGAYGAATEEIDALLSLKGNPMAQKEYFILRMHGVCEVYMGKKDTVSDRL
ncbi:PIG-L family deacetylase [Patescibacteria group bacterium]|nr:PIG-L family deacetylase [Patescibacteria group bacterium]MBU1472230.1 PIG-L family deacetylase [Patescibacteria group bacterium]MBU2460518.1 PIG-L family deacetylase [Patescibacteria group bacterium]